MLKMKVDSLSPSLIVFKLRLRFIKIWVQTQLGLLGHPMAVSEALSEIIFSYFPRQASLLYPLSHTVCV